MSGPGCATGVASDRGRAATPLPNNRHGAGSQLLALVCEGLRLSGGGVVLRTRQAVLLLERIAAAVVAGWGIDSHTCLSVKNDKAALEGGLE